MTIERGSEVQITAYLAAREELGPSGFFLWAGLICINGAITWTAAEVAGRGPKCSVRQAQSLGAVQILRRLRALREQQPTASLAMITDSQQFVAELRGEWAQSQRNTIPQLDESITLLRTLEGIDLRYCSRASNLEAHVLITQLCAQHGVAVKARHVKDSR